MTVNVICMKWGTLYGPEYVNKLRSMVKRNLTLPHRFMCLTDDTTGLDADIETMPIPEIEIPKKNAVSPWKKLTLLSPKLGDLKGKTLFLDLDIVIVDNIDCFFEYSNQSFCIIENWTQKGQGIGNSSVYMFEIGKYGFIYENFIKNMDKILNTYDNEQIYISKQLSNIKFWPEEWCKSFKFHCLPGGPLGILNWFITPKLPEKVKIVVFHGTPKPTDAIEGKWPGSWRKHVKPTEWIEKYWK